MKKKPLYISVVFLIASLVAIFLDKFSDLTTIFEILSVLILVSIILLRVNIKRLKFNVLNNPISSSILLFSLSLFIILLITSTGAFFSPLLITLHITTLCIAFLLSFPLAMVFLFSGVLALSIHSYTIYASHAATFDPALLIIQLASIVGIIPFSSIAATRYHVREKIADYFFAELSLSKSEESLILDNIAEGVITMNRKFSIVKINKIAENLSGFKPEELAEKDFFEVFKLYDIKKDLITKDQFPIHDLLNHQTGFSESGLFMQKKDSELFNIDFKFSSVVGAEGKIEAFLFVFNERQRNLASSLPVSVLQGSFDKFQRLISSLNENITTLEQNSDLSSKDIVTNLNKNSKRMLHAYKNLHTLYELSMGEIPGLLSDLDVGKTVVKMIDEAGDLAKQYNVSLINSAPIAPSLPIKTNKIIFEEAIGKIIELGIFIASSSQDQFIIVSIGSSQDNIFVFVKAAAYENFPWSAADELLKPFFGTLSDTHELSEASGLEGYLADRLLKEKGISGGITAAKFEDGLNHPQLILTVILPNSEST